MKIVDNKMDVQEAIHSSLETKGHRFIMKLDMANAFYRGNLSFLSVALHKFGFAPDFVDLIKACITTPWISPLINGRPFKAQEA